MSTHSVTRVEGIHTEAPDGSNAAWTTSIRVHFPVSGSTASRNRAARRAAFPERYDETCYRNWKGLSTARGGHEGSGGRPLLRLGLGAQAEDPALVGRVRQRAGHRSGVVGLPEGLTQGDTSADESRIP